MPRRGTEADGHAAFRRSPRSISIFPGAQCSMGMGCRGFAPASFWLAYPAARANAQSSARRGHSLRHVQDSASWGDSSIVTQDQRILESFQQVLYLIILLGWCCSCSTIHLAFESAQRGGDRGLHNTPYLDQVQCRCNDCGLKGFNSNASAQCLFHCLGLDPVWLVVELSLPLNELVIPPRIKARNT